MDCPFTPQVGAYLDGELGGEQRRLLDIHLSVCDICSQEERELLGLRAMFAAEPQVTNGVIARLHEQANGLFDRSILRIARALSAVAACLLVAGTMWLGEPQRPPMRPQQWEEHALLMPPADSPPVNSAGLIPAEWAMSNWSSRGDEDLR